MSQKGLKILWSSLMLIIFSLVNLSDLSCQHYSERTYGVSDGLPQSSINSIRQDSRGYLWISTKNGLARFDGIEAVTYFKRNGLASSHVLLTFDDLNKKLWALSNNGLSFFNGTEFFSFPIPDNLRLLYPVVCPSADSTIYLLAFRKGAYKRELYVFKNGIYTRFSEDISLTDSTDFVAIEFDPETSLPIALDARGNLWIIRSKFLEMVPGIKANFIYIYNGQLRFKSGDRYFRYNKGSPTPLNRPYGSHAEDPVIVAQNIDRDVILNYSIFNDTAKILLPAEESGYITDDEGVMWYYTGSSLSRLITPLFQIFDQSELPFKNLWAIAEDKAGTFWFGSINGHLMKFTGDNFTEITGFDKNRSGWHSFYKGSLKMMDSSIWFSTDRGILVWDGSEFSWHKDIPDNTQVCHIFEDNSNGKILVGTNRGLYILHNGKTKLMKEFLDSELGVVEGVAKNDSGGYWISGHRGLVRLDGEVATPVSFPGLPEENTFTLCSDKAGGLWITSDEGLWYRNSQSGVFTPALPDGFNMPANSILAIDDNRIIVGRATDICLIYIDSFYLNKPDYYRIFDRTDGFMADVCIDNGIIKTLDGKVWILTNNEIVRINPDGIRINNKPPDLYITGTYYRDETNKWIKADAGNLFYDNPAVVNLTRKQNKIRITFTGISTTNPERVTYIHRLSGYEKEWSSPGVSRYIEYDNLSPGSYHFEIMACNADGIRTPVPQKITFIIHPAIWQRPVFITFIALLSLLLTALMTGLYLRKKQREKEESQRLRNTLSRLQLKAVLGQFDPHFTFNVISSLGSLVMKGEKETAYEYITRLSALLRSSISSDKLIIIPISEELELVKDYCDLHKLRFRDRFSYEINIAPEVDQGRLIPRMTIQSFVENAIKHGIENSRSGGNLWITVEKQNDSIEIKIRDNGIGRTNARIMNTAGTGAGLKTISQMFDYFNGLCSARCFYEISDITEQDKPSGTLVRIVIPDICDFDMPDLNENESDHM